jgi:hypothetical protein
MTTRYDVSNPGYSPLRVSAEGIRHLSSLTQFHAIADDVLIRLAERRTRLTVPDRWVAIALILSNRIPIPVPSSRTRVQTGGPRGSREAATHSGRMYCPAKWPPFRHRLNPKPLLS